MGPLAYWLLGPGRRAPNAARPLKPPYYPCEVEGQPVRALLAASVRPVLTHERQSSICPIYDETTKNYSSPSADECERLLGFTPGVTAIPGWSDDQRKSLLAQANDVTHLSAIFAMARVLADEIPAALEEAAPAACVSACCPRPGLARALVAAAPQCEPSVLCSLASGEAAHQHP